MNIAVRYYSRGGNTKALAEAMAQALGVEALSVDDPKAALTEKVDLLVIGGAIYARQLDKHLRTYLDGLDGQKVAKAACFSTSGLSQHGIDLLKKAMEEKGIQVLDTFYCKGKEAKEKGAEAQAFAKKLIEG